MNNLQNNECQHGCNNCIKKNPNYVLGSSILTLFVAGLVFLVSLAWSQYVNKKIEEMMDPEKEVQTRLYYAILITLIAIVVIFFLLYYLPGEKC